MAVSQAGNVTILICEAQTIQGWECDLAGSVC